MCVFLSTFLIQLFFFPAQLKWRHVKVLISLTGDPAGPLSSALPSSWPAVAMTTPPLVPSFGGQPPQLQQQQAQAARDVNTSSLCRIGQETVQDIVLRTMEIFQLLRNMQVCLALSLSKEKLMNSYKDGDSLSHTHLIIWTSDQPLIVILCSGKQVDIVKQRLSAGPGF